MSGTKEAWKFSNKAIDEAIKRGCAESGSIMTEEEYLDTHVDAYENLNNIKACHICMHYKICGIFKEYKRFDTYQEPFFFCSLFYKE